MRLFFAMIAVLIVMPSGAIADENPISRCEQWGWHREDASGYLTTETFVCSGKEPDRVYLEFACGEAQTFWIGYGQKESGEELPDSATFVFENTSGSQSLEFSPDYLENLLSVNIPRNAPLLTMLKRGASFTIRQQGKADSTHTFTLDGAPGAIYALEIGCKPQED